MASPVVLNAIYVILGASGNTGSIIAHSLLSKGQKVRVMGRDAARLQRFVRAGVPSRRERTQESSFQKSHVRRGTAHRLRLRHLYRMSLRLSTTGRLPAIRVNAPGSNF